MAFSVAKCSGRTLPTLFASPSSSSSPGQRRRLLAATRGELRLHAHVPAAGGKSVAIARRTKSPERPRHRDLRHCRQRIAFSSFLRPRREFPFLEGEATARSRGAPVPQAANGITSPSTSASFSKNKTRKKESDRFEITYIFPIVFDRRASKTIARLIKRRARRVSNLTLSARSAPRKFRGKKKETNVASWVFSLVASATIIDYKQL